MSQATKPAKAELTVRQHVSFRGFEADLLRLEAVATSRGVSLSKLIRECVEAHLPTLELQAQIDPVKDRVVLTECELTRERECTGRLVHTTVSGRRIYEGERAC